MIVLGVDFTSAPSARKPITVARCRLDGGRLRLEALDDITRYGGFEALLRAPGPWIAGMDFPFGQARRFIETIGWPADWDGYVAHVAAMSRAQFVDTLTRYRTPRAAGDKEHRRDTDQRAGSISPQKLYGVPVGKMFYEGAPRLRQSPASIPPVRVTGDSRTVVEAYPALVARRIVGRASYKTEDRRRQTAAQHDARRCIVDALRSDLLLAAYGVRVRLAEADAARCINDATADRLDALLCAVQAAWTWQRRADGYGIPRGVDALEGWIVDPGLVG